MDSKTERRIEWECQKVIHQFYHHVDHYEFEKAVLLFTEDSQMEGGRARFDGTR